MQGGLFDSSFPIFRGNSSIFNFEIKSLISEGAAYALRPKRFEILAKKRPDASNYILLGRVIIFKVISIKVFLVTPFSPLSGIYHLLAQSHSPLCSFACKAISAP